MSNYQILHGDCLERLKEIEPNSIDAIVTDPPYGLGFMGKKWDIGVPAVDVFAECLRVLKPGGHLLAFGGSRTYHRLAVAVEDAGFEIRDQIMWVYGSGFPKSQNVSKAIDKAAGAERKVVGTGKGRTGAAAQPNGGSTFSDDSYQWPGEFDITTAATDAARQWEGWGTALKPSIEPLVVARKPLPHCEERRIIVESLSKLESRLWSLSLASTAEPSSTLSQSAFDEALNTAQWTADECINMLADLRGQMDTSQLGLAINTSLSIVSSWRRTWGEVCSLGSTSTIETKLRTTTDLRTLKFSLSEITPHTIIQAATLPGGWSAVANSAARYFSAELSKLSAILELSALERAISRDHHASLDVDESVNHEPIVVARKPLIGTVAANVLEHGTGALNIDGCRVGDESTRRTSNAGTNGMGWGMGKQGHLNGSDAGRWPANLIHDGSDEVLAAFPDSKGQQGDVRGTEPSGVTDEIYGKFVGRVPSSKRADTGSAARFFYCAKASKKDRDAGMEASPDRVMAASNQAQSEVKRGNLHQGTSGVNSAKIRKNHHPTVKPTDLMRYLVRLVTPQGGTVLDPFMGSGSTGKAAILEGFDFIGIEKEAEYLPIARARLIHAGGTDAEFKDDEMAFLR